MRTPLDISFALDQMIFIPCCTTAADTAFHESGIQTNTTLFYKIFFHNGQCPGVTLDFDSQDRAIFCEKIAQLVIDT